MKDLLKLQLNKQTECLQSDHKNVYVVENLNTFFLQSPTERVNQIAQTTQRNSTSSKPISSNPSKFYCTLSRLGHDSEMAPIEYTWCHFFNLILNQN